MTQEIYEECRLASVLKELERVELELQKVKKTLEQSTQEKPWPQDGDKYFYITVYGSVYSRTVENGDCDEGLQRVGNFYRTREQAEQIAQNRKVHTMLKELADFETDWEDVNQPKHFLCWGYRKTKEDVDFAFRWQTPNTVYFKTEEEGQKAIQAVKDKFGDDAIELYCKHGVI